MSDAGDEIQVDAPAEVEVSTDAAPKGKLSVEDALQVFPKKITRAPSSFLSLYLELYSKS